MQMIFNELSLIEKEMDENQAAQIFEQFISTYSEAVKKKNRKEAMGKQALQVISDMLEDINS